MFDWSKIHKKYTYVRGNGKNGKISKFCSRISCRYLFEARLVAGKHDEEEARDVANYVNSRLHN